MIFFSQLWASKKSNNYHNYLFFQGESETSESGDPFGWDFNQIDSDGEEAAVVSTQQSRDKLYKNRPSRKIDSWILFSREYYFPKTFSLTENQFSGKTYFSTIASSNANAFGGDDGGGDEDNTWFGSGEDDDDTWEDDDDDDDDGFFS